MAAHCTIELWPLISTPPTLQWRPSVLGPVLFILYTTPFSHLIESSSVDHHLYADDTQLFLSFSPDSSLHLNRTATLCGKPNVSMDAIQPPLPQPFQNRIYHNRSTCSNQENP